MYLCQSRSKDIPLGIEVTVCLPVEYALAKRKVSHCLVEFDLESVNLKSRRNAA